MSVVDKPPGLWRFVMAAQTHSERGGGRFRQGSLVSFASFGFSPRNAQDREKTSFFWWRPVDVRTWLDIEGRGMLATLAQEASCQRQAKVTRRQGWEGSPQSNIAGFCAKTELGKPRSSALNYNWLKSGRGESLCRWSSALPPLGD